MTRIVSILIALLIVTSAHAKTRQEVAANCLTQSQARAHYPMDHIKYRSLASGKHCWFVEGKKLPRAIVKGGQFGRIGGPIPSTGTNSRGGVEGHAVGWKDVDSWRRDIPERADNAGNFSLAPNRKQGVQVRSLQRPLAGINPGPREIHSDVSTYQWLTTTDLMQYAYMAFPLQEWPLSHTKHEVWK